MVNVILNKKLYAFIVLSALLVAFFVQFNAASAATTVDTAEVLVFLKDVVQLDTSKYEATLTTKATNYWPWLDGFAQTTGQYTLDSTGLVDSTGQCGTSIVTVSFTFWDEKLISCSIYEESQGPTLYSKQPATDLRAAASDFLQRYQAYTDDAQLTQMRSLLNTVEVTANTTKTVDNLSIEVYIEEDKTFFTWGNTLNGADYSRLRLKFQNGQFASFGDDRSFYELGSSEVNISQEEALDIALKRVESFTYTYKGKNITLTSANIVKEDSLLYFSFLNRTKRFEVYPIWIVDLPLDDLYPGNIAFIKVMLWADSGEVISCEALGYGFPFEEPYLTPTPFTENTEPDNNGEAPSAVYIAVACVVIAISIAVVAVFLKKRRQ